MANREQEPLLGLIDEAKLARASTVATTACAKVDMTFGFWICMLMTLGVIRVDLLLQGKELETGIGLVDLAVRLTEKLDPPVHGML